MSILEGVQDDYVAEYQVACLSEDGTSNIAKEFKVVQNQCRCKSCLHLNHNVLMSSIVKMTSNNFCLFSNV